MITVECVGVHLKNRNMIHSKKDMLSFVDFIIENNHGPDWPDESDVEKEFDEWIKSNQDNNPRIILTKDHMLMQFDSQGLAISENAQRLPFKAGAEFRQYGCPDPDAEYIVCDYMNEDSPEVRLYLVPQVLTRMKDD